MPPADSPLRLRHELLPLLARTHACHTHSHGHHTWGSLITMHAWAVVTHVMCSAIYVTCDKNMHVQSLPLELPEGSAFPYNEPL